ncbi:MAG: type II toxin-antitoxin system RelE/ParE family toxin [Pseudomonadales bacterium]|nr:type II toxin-antitoxin system RelE/ParE family toxin [Pseudomonadales bacterium]
MGRYRLSEDAKDDLIRIDHRGVREFGEARAEAYFQPLAYPAVDEIRVGYRRSVCGADSICYRIVGDGVEVMAIIGQQAWP